MATLRLKYPLLLLALAPALLAMADDPELQTRPSFYLATFALLIILAFVIAVIGLLIYRYRRLQERQRSRNLSAFLMSDPATRQLLREGGVLPTGRKSAPPDKSDQ